MERVSQGDVSDDLKTKAAWLYYMEGLTHDKISEILGLSRSRVLRILANSRQSGMVQIRVTTKLSYCVSLERQLETGFGLERAIVIPNPQDATATSSIISAALGAYLSDNIPESATIGLGWGKTLTASLPGIEYREKSGVSVLSMLGGLTRVSEYVLLERDERATLQAAGAVGDVLCRFIDADGNIIDHPVNERVVAVDPRDLHSARKLILASGGWQKYEVIRGAMRLMKPNVLVTDEVVAERLVADLKS